MYLYFVSKKVIIFFRWSWEIVLRGLDDFFKVFLWLLFLYQEHKLYFLRALMLAALSQKHIIRSSWFSWINEKKRPKITQVKSLQYYFCTVRSFPRAINQKPNISQKQDLKDASPPTVDQFKHQKWSQWKANREKSKRYTKLHKKWTENHWPQVSWSDKYKCKIYGSDQHRHVQKYQEKGTTQ